MKVYVKNNDHSEKKNENQIKPLSETVNKQHPLVGLLPFYSLDIKELLACKCDKRFRASSVSLISCLLFYTALFFVLLGFGIVINVMSETINIFCIIIGFLAISFGWAAVYLTLSFESKPTLKIDLLIAKFETIFLIGLILVNI